MTTTTSQRYHYTECGLDYIWLLNGFDFVSGPGGRRQVKIKDIDGLHASIGRMLITIKKNLTGKEFRFLRHEMGMSQTTLAKWLETSEQAIHRWEKGKSSIPKLAEAFIRLLYRDHVDHKAIQFSQAIQKIADMEDANDWHDLNMRKPNNEDWRPEPRQAA